MAKSTHLSFSPQRRLIVFISLVGCLGLVIIATTVGFREQISPLINSAYGTAFLPVMEAGDEAAQSISNDRKSKEVLKLEEKLAQLQAANAELKMQVDELQVAQQTVRIIPEKPVHAVSIKVLGMTGEQNLEKLRVRLPDRTVPEKGEAIVGPEGYIGRVESVVDDYALIELVNKETTRLGAMSERTNELGLVSWSDELDSVVFIPEKSVTEIGDGDIIMTSGLKGSTLLSRIPIGKVTRLDRNRFGEEVAVIELSQSLDGIQYAVLLQNVMHDDWED